jgi:hypothetical protein
MLISQHLRLSLVTEQRGSESTSPIRLMSRWENFVLVGLTLFEIRWSSVYVKFRGFYWRQMQDSKQRQAPWGVLQLKDEGRGLRHRSWLSPAVWPWTSHASHCKMKTLQKMTSSMTCSPDTLWFWWRIGAWPRPDFLPTQLLNRKWAHREELQEGWGWRSPMTPTRMWSSVLTCQKLERVTAVDLFITYFWGLPNIRQCLVFIPAWSQTIVMFRGFHMQREIRNKFTDKQRLIQRLSVILTLVKVTYAKQRIIAIFFYFLN